MKKAIALLLICAMPLLFLGCKAGSGSGIPVIQTSFNQTATVTCKEVTYPCRISRTDTADLVVEMLEGAPNAGVVYACSANNTMVTLENMTFTLTPEEVQENALIFTLSSLFNAMGRKEGITVKPMGDGFQYEGNCKTGPFTVTQRANYSYESIVTGDYQINFDT